jgi:hypothetical protein
MESGLEEIEVDLLEDSLAGMSDGNTPKARFPVFMERDAWRESHHGAGAASEYDWGFFGFPTIGAAIRAGIIGLVEVLGSLADFNDIGESLLVKVPVGIRVEFPIRIWVTIHGSRVVGGSGFLVAGVMLFFSPSRCLAQGCAAGVDAGSSTYRRVLGVLIQCKRANPVRLAPRLDSRVHWIDGQNSHYVSKSLIRCSPLNRSGGGSHRIEAFAPDKKE